MTDLELLSRRLATDGKPVPLDDHGGRSPLLSSVTAAALMAQVPGSPPWEKILPAGRSSEDATAKTPIEPKCARITSYSWMKKERSAHRWSLTQRAPFSW